MSSTTSSFWPTTLFREIMPRRAISMMMPTVTWTPWKPVSV